VHRADRADGSATTRSISYAKDAGRHASARTHCARRLSISRLFGLGWNDNMAINICQRQLSSPRVIDHIEHDHKTLDY
jgi:hypothetical protein